FLLFFFSSRRRHTRFSRDWSSDVCSSDLGYTKVDVTLGSQIIKLLKNPASNLFLAGKHLANLHGQRPGWDEKETRRVVAAWNGSGPDAQRYADRYFKALPTVKSIIGR